MTRTHTILVAEEHPATRNFLIDNLAADGYRTLAAEDRAKALALLDVEHPDLVVVDINGDTLELLDAVRSATGLASRIDPDTPLIALTGRSDAIHRIRLLERGGDDVVAKPFTYPELRAGCCDAPARRGPLGSTSPTDWIADDRRARARGPGRRPAGRAVGQGVRAAARRCPATRRGCSRAKSCSVTCGVPRACPDENLTATPTGCAASSGIPGLASWS